MWSQQFVTSQEYVTEALTWSVSDIIHNGGKCTILSGDCITINNLLRIASTFTMLWANSADNRLMIFFIFPRKWDLTFHADCLPRRQFA